LLGVVATAWYVAQSTAGQAPLVWAYWAFIDFPWSLAYVLQGPTYGTWVDAHSAGHPLLAQLLYFPHLLTRNSRHALVVRSYRAHRQAGGIHEDQGSPITSAMNCSVVDALLALLRAIAGIAIVDPAPHPCRPPCVVLARLAEAPDSAGLPAVVGGGSWLGAEWLGTSDASF
jgi:hypothetical protein